MKTLIIIAAALLIAHTSAHAEEKEPARIVVTQKQLDQFAWEYYSAGINDTVMQLIEKCAGVENSRVRLTADGLQYEIICRSAQF